MNEWSVVGVLCTLLGMAAAVLPPVVRLNNSITRNNTLLTLLQARYDKNFEQLGDEARRLTARADDHEKRLSLLEHDHGQNHPHPV